MLHGVVLPIPWCISLQAVHALNQLPHNEICRHDQRRGHQLQHRQESGIQPQHIPQIGLQEAGENAGGQHGTKGPDEVADEHLRCLHFIRSDCCC